MIIKNKGIHITIKNLLIIFLIVQPIFDLKVFYNSISTLIRVGIISAFFIYYFIKSKSNKKYLLLIYPIVLSVYFLLHDWNARMNFSSVVDNNFNYSTLKEFLYLIKMLTPYLLIYCLYKSEIKKKELIYIIKVWTLTIGTIIIISNIFYFSYGTYSDMRIKGNFFSWFNNTYNYKDLCSKGLFEYGNQISAILIMTLSILMYQAIVTKEKKDKIFNFIFLFINIFSLILIGTKVAVFGIGVVITYITIVILIFDKKVIKNNFKNIGLVLIFIIFYAISIPINPTFSRIEENSQTLQTSLNIESNIEENGKTENDEEQVINKYKYVKINYPKYQINQNFIEKCYPYKDDVDFWYNILNCENAHKSEYRFLEKAMVKRVIELNNNRLDNYLGISNTRIQNIFNIEQDFVVQYYSLGILGVILIFIPYLGIICYYTYELLKNKFKEKQIVKIVSIITAIFIFGISYYSGNLLNSLSFTIYYTILYGIILSTSDEK